jgi:hypothetical protein
MNVNETMSVVSQLKMIVDLANRFELTRDQILRGILNVASDLEDQANDLDEAMYNELGHAYENYDDVLITKGA